MTFWMVSKMEKTKANRLPEGGDFHQAKRELLKRGVRSGRLTVAEIRRALPTPHFSAAEMELFLFSLGMLGVDVVATDR